MRNTKLDFHRSEFWYIKGYDHYHAKSGTEMESAIDSYRQAIRIQPYFLDAIHNLACSYEDQKRFVLGMKWFEVAIKLDPSKLDSYHGYALCSFKTGNPSQSVEYLNKAISMLNNKDLSSREHYHLIYFRYLRSVCYKALGRFDEAQKDYGDINKAFEL